MIPGLGDVNSVDDLVTDEVTAPDVMVALLVLLLAVLLSWFLRRMVRRIVKRSEIDEQIGKLIGRLLSATILLLGIIGAMVAIHIDVGPFIVTLGFIGFALTFVLRDALENFAAGMLLQARRPFQIGDQVQAGDHEGNVVDISFRSVQLQQFSGERVYVPSRDVLVNPIINFTELGQRRTKLHIGVAYGTDLQLAHRLLQTVLDDADLVLDEPAPDVYLTSFDDSAITFDVRFWHQPRRVEGWQCGHEVLMAIWDAFADADIEIPFPQRTIWHRNGATDVPPVAAGQPEQP